MKLSVVLAVQNEEVNLKRCLESVKDIADEIIVVDDGSIDKTSKVAKNFGAKVYPYKHRNNFHEAKQFGIEKAKSEWILQLDADEVVTKDLRNEIENVILRHSEVASTTIESGERSYQGLQPFQDDKKNRLFQKYQKLIEQRDKITFETEGEIVAYFIPRLNIFLGKPIKHGGIYPDAVIRLWKRGSAYLPAKDVHELPVVKGSVGWIMSDLLHYDSPTFSRYLDRMNRYTDLHAKNYAKDKLPANIFYLLHYSFIKPGFEFINLYFRHKGVLDGFPGFVWSLFSALRFPVAYFKYWQTVKE